MTHAPTSKAPTIRSFQFDSSSTGVIQSNVNQFRGDVNMTQKLLTLPGRGHASPLDATVSVQYQSNVSHDAQIRNLEAPTSALGLGWSMPLSRIEAHPVTTAAPGAQRYTLHDGGTSIGLERQPVAPVVLTLDAVVCEGLSAPNNVPSRLRDAFLEHGLALSTQVTVSGTGPWTLTDSGLEQTYTAELAGGKVLIRDGGEFYQLTSYKFWKVIYYPDFARWVIVTDKAVRRSFGGGVSLTPQGQKTSAGNSVDWSVWWTDDDGVPAWTGTSSATQRQTQQARAWYLHTETDRFGSQLAYSYNDFERDDQGLIPGCEQLVGRAGKAYTKAVYLTGITDVFGRTVSFDYGNKVYGADAPDPREYADPHQAVPNNDPGPWQDRYETRYLSGLRVADASSTPLFSIEMEYAPRPGLSGAERAVANVTTNTGALGGDTFKRFLTSITHVTADGERLPGFAFEYDLNSDEQLQHPGALMRVVHPSGGDVSYTYKKLSLDICDRTDSVGVPSGALPRVFYGPDYNVVCFYDPDSNSPELSIKVRTWVGSWIGWQLNEDDAVLDTNGLNPATLEVVAQEDFLLVTFIRLMSGNSERVIYAFSRDVAKPGQWTPATIDGKRASKNNPNLTYSGQGIEVAIEAGDRFFVATELDADSGQGKYDRVTWQWSTQTWQLDTIAVDDWVWLAASAEYFVAIDMSTWRPTINYLDGQMRWSASEGPRVQGLQTVDPSTIALSAGSAMLVIAQNVAQNPEQVTNLWVLSWSANYQAELKTLGQVSDLLPTGDNVTPLGWMPHVVDDAMIALNGHLFRFDGCRWISNSALNPVNANNLDNRDVRYAYGPGYALQVIAPTTGGTYATAKAISVDAADGWHDPGKRELPIAPVVSQKDAYFPSAGGQDWATVGSLVFTRGSGSDWGKILASDPIGDIQKDFVHQPDRGFVSSSLVNQAAKFLSFGVSVNSLGGEPDFVQALLIKNGQLTPAEGEAFNDQLILPGGSGREASGPTQFSTFVSKLDTIDTATQLNLHRYAGYEVSGNIDHHVVVAATTNDGFGTATSTQFVPCQKTAGCDPSGDVVKFYETTSFPGTNDVSNPVNGWTKTTYLNGLNERTGTNFWEMLDGMKVGHQTFDAAGDLKASTHNKWNVTDRISVDPASPDSAPQQLRGGWVSHAATITMADGVSMCSESSYVVPGQQLAASNTAVVKTNHSYSGDGTAEVFETTSALAASAEPALAAIHQLTETAQETHTVTTSAGTTLTGSTATTYGPWPTAHALPVKAPAQTGKFALRDASTAAFDVVSDAPPAGWIVASKTTRRTTHGQPSCIQNPLGVPTLKIFDTNNELLVAQVANAAPGSAAVTSYQEYEDLSAWTLTNVEFDDDMAFTGTRAALLPIVALGTTPGASVSIQVEPRVAETYVVTLRYRTAAGVSELADTQLTATPSVDGTTGSIASMALEPTLGRWSYISMPVAVHGDGALSLDVSVVHRSEAQVWVDQTMVVPLASVVSAHTFDRGPHVVTSVTELSGMTTSTLLDGAFRTVGQVGPAGLFREIIGRGFSRHGSATDDFDPNSPNTEITAHAAGGGHVENFRDGGAWATRWAPATAADWSTNDGTLVHSGSAADTLTWTGGSSEGATALSFELIPEPGGGVALSIGDVSLRYTADTYEASQASQTWTPLISPPQIARHWLVIFGDGAVLFFADGQLVFSEKTDLSSGTVALELTGPGALRNLGLATGVELGITYKDATDRERQAVTLDGADSTVAATIVDGLDHHLATTKAAPGNFGKGATLPLLAYSPSFVDVPAFVAATASDWKMTGDVAEYYTGRDDGAVPDDQGYPYAGFRYEASPRKRKVEGSLAGADHAMGAATTHVVYGPNDAGTGSDLPASQYLVKSVTTPIQALHQQVTDQHGQRVATLHDGADFLEATRTYTNSGRGPIATMTQKLPNALVSGPQSDDAAFVKTVAANSLKETISLADPSTGETQFVYDDAGKLRFVRPAQDEATTWYGYYKYDVLDRQIEQGVVEGNWDRDTLQAEANDQSAPKAGSPQILVTFSGDGTEPKLLGKKAQSVSKNPEPTSGSSSGEVTVTETFSYDIAGNMASVGQTISDIAGEETLSYYYDTLHRVTRIVLPAGSPVEQIFYTRNATGKISAVGKSSGGTEFGAFTYTANGDIASQQVANGGWTRSYAYASSGSLQAVSTRDTTAAQGLDMAFKYEADKSMCERKMLYRGDAGTDLAETFTYDAERRIKTVEGSSTVEYSKYDANGNLWATGRGGETSTFTIEPGSDRVATAALDSGDPVSLTWTARGQLASGLGRTLEYDRLTGMTCRVATTKGETRLAYGGLQQRVLKQGPCGETVSLHGAGATPIARVTPAGREVNVVGPTGLLAVVSDKERYPIADAQGSVWAVVDDTTVVASYSYSPFGQLDTSAGSDAGTFPYRWQGREFDTETGLYDFRARLYDPALMRFHAPDPKRQYASPYIFGGNSPLVLVDPTGEISTGGQVGIGVGMAALITASIVVSIATLGIAAPEAAAADAAAGAAVAGAEAAADGLSAIAQVGIAVANGAVAGAAVKGLTYDIQHGKDFNTAHFFEAMGEGAAVGALTGGATFGAGAAVGAAETAVSAVGSAAQSLAAQIAVGASLGAVIGAASGDVSKLLTNLTQHKPWYQGLAMAAGVGAATGAASGALGAVGRYQIKETRVPNRFPGKLAKTRLRARWKPIAVTGAGQAAVSGFRVWGKAENHPRPHH